MIVWRLIGGLLGTFAAGLTIGGYWLSDHEGIRLGLQTLCVLMSIILVFRWVRT
jgi:hypothetical protein